MGKIKKPKVVIPRSESTTQPSLKADCVSDVNSIMKSMKNHTNKMRTVVSHKSVESCKSFGRIIKKKDKLNIKRKFLMKKIDVVNESKKQAKIREKRKNVSVIGDTNPLLDALPSIEDLIRSKSKSNNMLPKESIKNRGIGKARQRKKKLIEDMAVFKRILKNKTFSTNPFDIISNHLQAMVQEERNKLRTKS
ncbi:ribosome biogenesis protein SLX9 homolog [Diorhabda carinulata]|uniref:ribosome biogenesis protein SLX9 homolog n=1 Tax=Diorhabda carinulata TaxID=1163345 RepID=UPI0025A1471A|nr:ribosome biogenesis protein SLX9 homolog [Diorhabda carinulata]XP_057667170.1 ribosome biogenesis protein SLX9 homolog [Diorhabda carinulata]